jgi:hypothetical protein
MLSLWQNSHVLRGRQWTGRGEAQSRELVNSIKNVPVVSKMMACEVRRFASRERKVENVALLREPSLEWNPTSGIAVDQQDIHASPKQRTGSPFSAFSLN